MALSIIAGAVVGGGIGVLLGYFGKCSSGACPLTANPYRGAVFGALIGSLLAWTAIPGSKNGVKSPESAQVEEGKTSKENQGENEQKASKPSILHIEKKSPEQKGSENKRKWSKSSILHIENMDEFQTKILDSKGVFLVDLFSNRCPPCRVLAPRISSLAEEYAGRVTVCKVDVDRAKDIAVEYRIRAVPTVLIIKNGQLIKRLLGLKPKREYASILDRIAPQPPEEKQG